MRVNLVIEADAPAERTVAVLDFVKSMATDLGHGVGDDWACEITVLSAASSRKLVLEDDLKLEPIASLVELDTSVGFSEYLAVVDGNMVSTEGQAELFFA